MLNTATYDQTRFAAMIATRILMQDQIDALQEELDLREISEGQAELDAKVAYVVASDLGFDEMPETIQAWLADFACSEGLTETGLIAFLKQNDALPH